MSAIFALVLPSCEPYKERHNANRRHFLQSRSIVTKRVARSLIIQHLTERTPSKCPGKETSSFQNFNHKYSQRIHFKVQVYSVHKQTAFKSPGKLKTNLCFFFFSLNSFSGGLRSSSEFCKREPQAKGTV